MRHTQTNDKAPTSARSKRDDKIYSQNAESAEGGFRASDAMPRTIAKVCNNDIRCRLPKTPPRQKDGSILTKDFFLFCADLLEYAAGKIDDAIKSNFEKPLLDFRILQRAYEMTEDAKSRLALNPGLPPTTYTHFEKMVNAIAKHTVKAGVAAFNRKTNTPTAKEKSAQSFIMVHFLDLAAFLRKTVDAMNCKDNPETMAGNIKTLVQDVKRRHENAVKRGKANQKKGIAAGNQQGGNAAMRNQILTECRQMKDRSPLLSMASIAENVSKKHLNDDNEPVVSAKTIQNWMASKREKRKR